MSFIVALYVLSCAPFVSGDPLQCQRAFSMFVRTNQKIRGQRDCGIEYYHVSLRHGQNEWFVDRNGSSALNTLLEPCQYIIDYAFFRYLGSARKYFKKTANPFSLKIRQIRSLNLYVLYIKTNFETKALYNWFDIMWFVFEAHSVSNRIVKGMPHLRKSMSGMDGILRQFGNFSLQTLMRKHRVPPGNTFKLRFTFTPTSDSNATRLK